MQYAVISRKSGIEKNKKVSYLYVWLKWFLLFFFFFRDFGLQWAFGMVKWNYIKLASRSKRRVAADEKIEFFFEQPVQWLF